MLDSKLHVFTNIDHITRITDFKQVYLPIKNSKDHFL
jgi:hypothetical protein